MNNAIPMTKRERDNLLDVKASSIYACRRKIERLHEQQRLERSLREVWQ